MKTLDAVRELLTTGGRTLVQGALGWLWAHGDTIVPVPGARTVEQIEGGCHVNAALVACLAVWA